MSVAAGIIDIAPMAQQTTISRFQGMRLVHLTDPHLTSLANQSLSGLSGKRRLGYLSWKRKRRLVHRADLLEQITEAVHTESATQIVLSGDLAQIGLAEEISAAGDWLERLGSPQQVLLVPGNHDYYRADSWAAICDRWGPYLGAGQDASKMSPADLFPRLRQLEKDGVEAAVLGLCSAYPAPLLMADGRLGVDQLSQLDNRMEQARGFRCVILHHPPLPGMTAWRKALRDAGDLAGVLERHRPELVLHGHVHRNRTGPVSGGTRIFATASASSSRPEAPASYRVFDISREPDGWTVAMRLKGIAQGGSIAVLEESRWRVALKQTASAT